MIMASPGKNPLLLKEQTRESPMPIAKAGTNRRQFLGRASLAATAAEILGQVPAFGQSVSQGGFSQTGNTGVDPRVAKSFALRVAAATKDAAVAVPQHTTNGDEARYPDKSATYTKGLLQDDIGVVNLAAYQSFKKALKSGLNSDFEAMIIGGTRTQNGPQGAFAFDMEGCDSVQYGNAASSDDPTGPAIVPPFAQISSADYGTQLTELYWGSLLRDVAFTDYATNSTAIAAAAELSGMSSYRGPRDAQGKVTPDLLFRGGFAGETIGPYISQFMIT